MVIDEAVGVDAEGEVAVVTDPAVEAASGGAGDAEGGADYFPVLVDVAPQYGHRLGGKNGDRAGCRQR